jgi:phage shock protein PspC (stress-responsive transcriptional regulator)
MTEQPNEQPNENPTQHQSAQHQTTNAPPPPYQPPAQPAFRRLTRTTWDAPVSGVCGGVARYLGVDPTLVRVLAAITMVVTFPVGVIVYAVMWAVMPKE